MVTSQKQETEKPERFQAERRRLGPPLPLGLFPEAGRCSQGHGTGHDAGSSAKRERTERSLTRRHVPANAARPPGAHGRTHLGCWRHIGVRILRRVRPQTARTTPKATTVSKNKEAASYTIWNYTHSPCQKFWGKLTLDCISVHVLYGHKVLESPPFKKRTEFHGALSYKTIQ